MKEKSIGAPFTQELELTAGTSTGVLLGKLENIVLLDIAATSPKYREAGISKYSRLPPSSRHLLQKVSFVSIVTTALQAY